MATETKVPTHVIGHKTEGVTYSERLAVRSVVRIQANDQILLIYVPKGNYYKLPGGGIEADEDHQEALAREIIEETGCTISESEGTKLVAMCEEWRNDLHQFSFCYATVLKDDTGMVELTELEISEGLTHEWVSVPVAKSLMQNVQPTCELGRYIIRRDLFFIEKHSLMRWAKWFRDLRESRK